MSFSLSYFACGIVHLSVAVVTSTGMSNGFTPPITLLVYGGTSSWCQLLLRLIHGIIFIITETLFPSHPDTSTFTIEVEEDFRPGFSEHSIINLTWDRPLSRWWVEGKMTCINFVFICRLQSSWLLSNICEIWAFEMREWTRFYSRQSKYSFPWLHVYSWL